jgi:hypothetical protein
MLNVNEVDNVIDAAVKISGSVLDHRQLAQFRCLFLLGQ